MTLGEKIRQTRLLRGLSQENLADSLSLSTSAYGDIERNKTELTLNRAKQIAQILDISLLELLGLELEENNQKLDDQNMKQLTFENEKLKLEVEKLAFESLYWREKFEQRVLTEVYQILAKQNTRNKIGF